MRKFYFLLFTLLLGKLVSAQVNVSATAGTFNASYTTVKAAFDAINAGVHNGIISITITGNTTETATAVLNSGSVAPASYSVVLISPSAPAVVSGSIAGAVIKLNGADNVVIDGSIGGGGTDRSLTIQNNSTATATAAIWLSSVSAADGCSNNTIRSLELKTGIDATSSTNSTFGIIMCGTTISTTSNGVSNDNNSFINNRITKCRYGIVTRGTTTDLNVNPVVTDNLVGDNAFGADQVSKTGIFMQADQGALVSRNTIQFVGGLATQSASGADRNGIAIGTDSWTTSPGTLTGNTYTVTNNVIHDVVDEKTFSALGINLGATGGGTPTNNIVANNFIYNIRANGTGGDQTVGIGIAGGHTDKVVYNSIWLSGDIDPGTAASASSFGSGIRIGNNSGATHANLTLMNNIVHIDLSSNTATVRFYAISGTSSGYSFGAGGENYNDYYINAANPQVQTGGLGTASGNTLTTQFASLANWQTAYATAQDANSIQVDPAYMSTTNLHISTASSAVDGKATPISGISTDIDGNTRNGSTPDIGADEYDISVIPCVTPPDQPSSFVNGATTGTSIAGSFSPAASTPFGYIVIRSIGAFSGTLVNGVTYPAGTVIGNGTVVQASASTSFVDAGLASNTAYTFTIASYNAGTCVGGPMYNSTSMLTGSGITCPQPPGSLSTTLVTSNSFTLNWSSSAGGNALPVVYTAEVATDAAFTSPVAGSPFTINDPAVSQNITGLNPATTYYYRVSASNGCNSAFATGNATTICAAFTPPYLENFNSYLPTCWTEQTGFLNAAPTALTGTTSAWTNNGWLNTGSTGAAQVNLFSNTKRDWLISPTIDLGLAGNYQLEFDLATLEFLSSTTTSVLGSDDSLAVVISTDNGATWSNANIISLYTAANTPVPASGTHVTVPLNTYTGLVKIGFYGSEGSVNDIQDIDVMIDNVAINVIPPCGAISGLGVSNIQSTSADISWSITPGAVGYEYAVTTSPVPPASGTSLIATTVAAGGLMPSTQYYAHVRSECAGSLFGNWVTVAFFTLPGNDECITATPFPVIPTDGSCATLSNQTTFGATQSLPACVGVGADDDIWYSFVAPATSVIIESTTISGASDRVHQVFSGACGSLTSIACSDPETSTVTGLTVGQTYYVRVHTYFTASISVFNLCIKTPPPCVNPTLLSAGTITSNSAVLSWTENGLGTSWEIEVQPSPFTFTGIPTVTGITNPYTLTGLLPTTGYRFRVRATGCAANWSASSSIFTTLAVPPPNDDAPGAILLTLGTCSGNPFTNVNATQGATEPNPSCKSTGGFSTVWYRFVAPASGMVKISNDYSGGTLGDSRVALFSATDVNDYSTFSILACDDDNGVTVSNRSIIYMARLVPGNTYYIQVSGYSSFSTTGTFCLSVEELTASMISPVTGCGTGQSLSSVNNNYHGWLSAVDNNGNLVAQLRNGSGAGAGTSTYSISQHINAGPVRNNAGIYYLDRNYFINNGSVSNVDVQFFINQSEMTALNAADPTALLSTLGAAHQAGGTCAQNYSSVNGATQRLPQSFSAVTADGNAAFIQVQTPSFSNFYLQSSGVPVLPVELLSLAGQKEGGVNLLKWVTATERNNQGFEVQRSADGITYLPIGFVASAAAGGNSNSPLRYSFTDNSPAGARQYYRLRQVDIDSRSRLSNVIMITGARPAALMVVGMYPNPASTQLNVNVSSPVQEKVTLQIVDITGKSVLQIAAMVEAGSNTIPVDVSRLSNGSYVVKLVCSSYCDSPAAKFVKQ